MSDSTDPRSVANPANLHVAAAFFNFNLSANLLANFRRFAAQMAELGVTLHVAELVRGDLDFQVTDRANPDHLQFRTNDEVFQKENLVELALRNATRRYPDAKYLAWWDADVRFCNPNIARQTMEQLNRHKAVQCWGEACDLGPDGQPMVYPGPDGAQVSKSFGYCHQHSLPPAAITKRYGYSWHPGYAWAIRRDAWEAMGGLYEHGIVGSADNHMAWAFVGKLGWGLDPRGPAAYSDHVMAWCERAAAVVMGDVGYVPGLVLHPWHGRKTDRKYVGRMQILIDHDYHPETDVVRDHAGLLRLAGNKPGLGYATRAYLQNRNDDANTLG